MSTEMQLKNQVKKSKPSTNAENVAVEEANTENHAFVNSEGNFHQEIKSSSSFKEDSPLPIGGNETIAENQTPEIAGCKVLCEDVEKLTINNQQTKQLSHKKWRALVKKQKRQARRQAEAKAREEAELVPASKSPDTLAREAYEDKLKKVKEDYEEKLRLSQQLHWIEKEKRAQKEFQWQQERAVIEKQRREEEEKKIREEWEKCQKAEEEEREQAEQKKQCQEELLKEATKHEKKPGESPWHNPLAPERRPGIERDPCPFFIKVGACRFGDRCSRGHQYPDSSTTLLFPGMYTHFKLEHSIRDDYDADLGLEYEDSEMYEHFKDFFNDTVPEFKKHGKVVQFKVCCNHELHLRGNVYVQFADETAALQAYASFNGRWYGGKRLNCELCVVEKWRNAICGVFARNRCPKGRNCNFIHAFRNPGNMFWEADKDLVLDDRYSSRRHRSERRSRSRSPSRMSSRSNRRSRSPERNSRSYRSSSRMSSRSNRRSRSPRRRSRSPRKRSRSPRRRSRSPKRRSRSPKRRSRSPKRRSRSPSRSSYRSCRKSKSPMRKSSRSPRRSVSPEKPSSRSERRSTKIYLGSSSKRRRRSYSPKLRSNLRSPEYTNGRGSPPHKLDRENLIFGDDKETSGTTESQFVVPKVDEGHQVSAMFCETPPYADVDTTPEYFSTDPMHDRLEAAVVESIGNHSWDEGPGLNSNKSVGSISQHREKSWSEEREVVSSNDRKRNYRRKADSDDSEEDRRHTEKRRSRSRSEERNERRRKKRRNRSRSPTHSSDSSSSFERSDRTRRGKHKKKLKKKHSTRGHRKENTSPELKNPFKQSELNNATGRSPQNDKMRLSSKKSELKESLVTVEKLENVPCKKTIDESLSGDRDTRQSNVPRKFSFKVKKHIETNVLVNDKHVLNIFQHNDPSYDEDMLPHENGASITLPSETTATKNHVEGHDASDVSTDVQSGRSEQKSSKNTPSTNIAELIEQLPEKQVLDSKIVSSIKSKDKALEFLDSVIADMEQS